MTRIIKKIINPNNKKIFVAKKKEINTADPKIS
jgi:hypothetical protein